MTCFPSTTPFGLALGADSPCADERCAGTLGLSARRIFTSFIVTHVSIRTSDTSSPPPGEPSQAYRTLLYHAALHLRLLFAQSRCSRSQIRSRPTRLWRALCSPGTLHVRAPKGAPGLSSRGLTSVIAPRALNETLHPQLR